MFPLLLFSITKERTEVIFQGTLSPDPKDPEALWEEYQFMCKPGDVYRRPCLLSPYHYRLDWLMWFAAFQVKPHYSIFLFIILMLIKSFNVLILLLLLWLFISKCNQCGKALVPHFQHWGAVFPR